MPKISNFFVCFSVICGMARGARKQNGVWRQFLDFEECEREGLTSDYGTLGFVTCAEDGGISRCYLTIECTDEDKRGNTRWTNEKVRCRKFEYEKKSRAGQTRYENFFVFEKNDSVRVNRLLRPKRTNLCQ